MSVEDCPDCRKLQSECEALERELARARTYRESEYVPADPRAPKPVYVPAAVPKPVPPAACIATARRINAYCVICDREHES